MSPDKAIEVMAGRKVEVLAPGEAQDMERVNNFETLARRIYCSNSSLFAGLGGLIQAASGSLGGTGTFFTNLSGCAS
jgi:hypothetical protein